MSDSTIEKSLQTIVVECLIDGRSSVGQSTISPDGARVAFAVGTTNLKKNSGTSRIWIHDAPKTSATAKTALLRSHLTRSSNSSAASAAKTQPTARICRRPW